MKTRIVAYAILRPALGLLLLAALATPSVAADICTGTAQILLPNGTCLQGFDGASQSNCVGVANPVAVETASHSLVCVAGPACPTGYATSLPPYVGSPKGLETAAGVCQAVCSSVFVNHGWPCSCPYGQHLKGGQCVPTCGAGATWQHTPGVKWTETVGIDNSPPGTMLLADAGICTCPSGKEYVGATSSCMTPCPQGQSRDGSGQCIPPAGSGGPKYCANGQHVGGCQCPPTGAVKSGVCIICQIAGPNGPGSSSQDPACKAAMGSGTTGDQMPVFSPGGSSHCAPGTHFSKFGKCVSDPACGLGKHWDGKYCVRNAL